MENYFEYFTEIEDCFRRCRGTPTLLSTLDWALIESWKEAGIPLQAVLAGIERTFEKFATRPPRFRRINGLGYCSQAVLEAAEALASQQAEAGRRPSRETTQTPAAPFTVEELQAFVRGNARAMRASAERMCGGKDERLDPSSDANQRVLARDFEEIALALDRLADSVTEAPLNIQPLEAELAALEEKLTASVTRGCPAAVLVGLAQKVERGVAPYRSKMNSAQLDSLHRQFLKRSLYEHFGLPRLSLFYCTG